MQYHCPVCGEYRAKQVPHRSVKGLCEGDAYECVRCGSIRSQGRLISVGREARKNPELMKKYLNHE